MNLSSVRVVITDPDERYPKVHWDEAPSGAAFESLIEWDGRWADGSLAVPGEYLAWVKAADNAGNESFAVGRIRVEGKNAPAISVPSLATAVVLQPTPNLQPSTSHPQPFGGGPSTPQPSNAPTVNSQPANPQTTAFQSANNQTPIQNRQSEIANPKSPIANLLWGVTAAAAAGAFLSESLRRKKEREQQIEDYYRSRPVKVEAEGKGGRLTGGQIARAYQAAKNNFKAILQQAQAMGISAEQAAQLKADVAKSGKIGVSLGAAKEYIAHCSFANVGA